MVPQVRSAYQQRIAGNRQRDGRQRVSPGTASVAPAYGFPWMISLQIKSAPGRARTLLRRRRYFAGVGPDGCALCSREWKGGRIRSNRAIDKLRGRPVETGSNALSSGGKHSERSIASSSIPNFTSTRERVPENDVALLHVAGAPRLAPLQAAADKSRGREPAQGRQSNSHLWLGHRRHSRADSAISNTLLYAFVPVEAHTKCNAPSVYDGLGEQFDVLRRVLDLPTPARATAAAPPSLTSMARNISSASRAGVSGYYQQEISGSLRECRGL